MIIVVIVYALPIIHPEKTLKTVYQFMFSSTLHTWCIIPSKKLLISNSTKLSFLTLATFVKVISFTCLQTRHKFESENGMGGYLLFYIVVKNDNCKFNKKSYLRILLFIITDFLIYYILIHIEQDFSKYDTALGHTTHMNNM